MRKFPGSSVLQAGVLSFLLGVGFNANAGVIYDNGGILPLVSGANFSEGTRRLGDDFSLAGADTVTTVQFWGTRWSSGVQPATDDFSIAIYELTGNSVGSLVGSSTLNVISKNDTGLNHNGLASADIYEYNMSLANSIALAAGDYLLSVWSEEVAGTNFAWQRATGSGTSFRSTSSGSSWFTGRTGNNAWNISNDSVSVPEPSTFALLGLGLLGFGMKKRRQR